MIDMPDPCQSSISSLARLSTGSGNMAGPALKLNTRVMNHPRDSRPQGLILHRSIIKVDWLFGIYRLFYRRFTVFGVLNIPINLVFVLFQRLNSLDAHEFFPLAELDQANALGIATQHGDF